MSLLSGIREVAAHTCISYLTLQDHHHLRSQIALGNEMLENVCQVNIIDVVACLMQVAKDFWLRESAASGFAQHLEDGEIRTPSPASNSLSETGT